MVGGLLVPFVLERCASGESTLWEQGPEPRPLAPMRISVPFYSSLMGSEDDINCGSPLSQQILLAGVDVCFGHFTPPSSSCPGRIIRFVWGTQDVLAAPRP